MPSLEHVFVLNGLTRCPETCAQRLCPALSRIHHGGVYWLLAHCFPHEVCVRAFVLVFVCVCVCVCLCVWDALERMQDPIDDLVLGMSAQCGRSLIELIEVMFGRAPPGRVNPDRLSAVKKEAVAQILHQYEEIISFVKGYGGLLAGIRPEYLLRYEDYCRIDPPGTAAGGERGTSANAGASTMSTNVPGTASNKGRHLTERRFMYRAMHAWMTLIFQIIRIFGLAKVHWKSFSTQHLTPQVLYLTFLLSPMMPFLCPSMYRGPQWLSLLPATIALLPLAQWPSRSPSLLAFLPPPPPFPFLLEIPRPRYPQGSCRAGSVGGQGGCRSCASVQ